MKQGDTVFVSATATGLGKDKKAVIANKFNLSKIVYIMI